MKSVLVTGAGGYLGGEIIRQLLDKKDRRIIALTSQKEGFLSSYNNATRLSCYDLTEWENGKIPWGEVDALLHCAFARSSEGYQLADSLRFTHKIFRDAENNKVPVIVNISSQGVYGGLYKPMWSEVVPVAPKTLYGMAKYSSELLCLGIDNSIVKTNLRLASLTGGARGLRLEVISKFVKHAIEGESIKIIGGGQVFSYLDVRDAAEAIITLLSTNSKDWKAVYNLGPHARCNIVEIAILVNQIAIGFSLPEVEIRIEKGDIHLDVGMDSNLFYNAANWRPRFYMKDTIESLFRYLLNLKDNRGSGGAL